MDPCIELWSDMRRVIPLRFGMRAMSCAMRFDLSSYVP